MLGYHHTNSKGFLSLVTVATNSSYSPFTVIYCNYYCISKSMSWTWTLHLPLAISFFSSWKALTTFTIRGRYLFLAVALEEYLPVLIGRSARQNGERTEGRGRSKNIEYTYIKQTGSCTGGVARDPSLPQVRSPPKLSVLCTMMREPRRTCTTVLLCHPSHNLSVCLSVCLACRPQPGPPNLQQPPPPPPLLPLPRTQNGRVFPVKKQKQTIPGLGLGLHHRCPRS